MTRDMADAGARLVTLMQESGVQLDLAFWIFNDETNRWKFCLVSPQYDGPDYRSVYSKLHEALKHFDEFDSDLLANASVTSPTDRVAKTLQYQLAKAPNRKTVRITRWAPQDIWIEDALVYRTTQPALSIQYNPKRP